MKKIKSFKLFRESKGTDIEKLKSFLDEKYTTDWFNSELSDRVFDYVDEDQAEEYDGDYEMAYQEYASGGAIEYDLLSEMEREVKNELDIDIPQNELLDILNDHLIDNCEWRDMFVFSKSGEDKNDIFGLLESLSYSGKDVTKMPVIGKVISKPIADFDSAEYNVVEIIDDKGKDIYVLDFWYKPGVPQLIHSDLAEKFIPATN